MTGRDRIVVIGIAVLLVLGAAWMLVVSPERKQAATLQRAGQRGERAARRAPTARSRTHVARRRSTRRRTPRS